MPSLRNRLKYLSHRIRESRSANGRNVLLYLLFVGVAFIFWMAMSLDNQVQRDFEIPLELEELSDSVTVVTPLPQSISVSVKGKGYQIIRFLWRGTMPSLKIRFETVKGRPNQIYYSRAKLDSRLREYFGNGVQIISCKPDTLRLFYTGSPGKKVPLIVEADIHTNLQYMISGPIKASVDSVTLYSVKEIPRSLDRVKTEPLVRSDLRDTTKYQVRVQQFEGIRVEPDVVTVTVPVEPLIAKKRNVMIQTRNVPPGYNLILFPTKIEVNCLVPMSEYSNELPVTVYADFQSIKPGMSHIPVSVSAPPDITRGITLSADSVEFIIEKR